MPALAQCWFTRIHQPEGRVHKGDDSSHSGYCRHCERAIVSWDRRRWFLAGGFNVTRLAETVSGRFVILLDTAEQIVIARYPVSQIADPAALEAFKAELRERHGADQPGSAVELFDSGEKGATRRTKQLAPPRQQPGQGARLALN